MACPCKNKEIVVTPENTKRRNYFTEYIKLPTSVAESMDIDEPQCYLCAKKHLNRAKINFEEYHTGYPDHIKNLMFSMRVAEDSVRQAFIDWQSVQGHLDMAAGELLGNDLNSDTMEAKHIELANKIRKERLSLQDDPLYCPNFDELLLQVQLLEQSGII